MPLIEGEDRQIKYWESLVKNLWEAELKIKKRKNELKEDRKTSSASADIDRLIGQVKDGTAIAEYNPREIQT